MGGAGAASAPKLGATSLHRQQPAKLAATRWQWQGSEVEAPWCSEAGRGASRAASLALGELLVSGEGLGVQADRAKCQVEEQLRAE